MGADGRILDVGIARSGHGRVVVTCVPAFDERARHDQDAVRRYRAGLASPDRPGFGLGLAGEVEIVGGSIPRFRSASSELFAFAPARRRGIVQVARGPVAPSETRGEPRLDRAAYTQLTEGGPLPPPQGDLGEMAVARGPGALAVAFGDTREAAEREAAELARDAGALLERELRERQGRTRELSWLLDCVVCDVGGGAAALLADHEILPLVWTRDAYYVARALLRTGEGRAAVGSFLRWCFGRAGRVDGSWWPRSSLATGEVKDRAFQLDQQLYPLLLLAEMGGADLDRYRPDAEARLDAVLARADGGLVATSETPADDPLEEAFHFSSHVLLWRTLLAYRRDPEALRRLILDRFTHDGRFAYAVGRGVRHYHDANDLPTVLAPLWGFCAADDPVWRATVAFAWSGDNDGHFAGPLGGLGSLHTPHPWPLGDLQRLIVARATRDADLERDAWTRLRGVETWDGLLPEAYHERDGSVVSRHWFAWPVALRASLAAGRVGGRPRS